MAAFALQPQSRVARTVTAWLAKPKTINFLAIYVKSLPIPGTKRDWGAVLAYLRGMGSGFGPLKFKS